MMQGTEHFTDHEKWGALEWSEPLKQTCYIASSKGFNTYDFPYLKNEGHQADF